MSKPESSSTSICIETTVSYRNISLVKLIQYIVDHSDTDALRELQEHRTVFQYLPAQKVRFMEYLEWRCHSIRQRDEELADLVFEDVFRKLNELPSDIAVLDRSPDGSRWKGKDCRNQYRAFLRRGQEEKQKNPNWNELEEEAMAAKTLQGLVDLHFGFSIKDCMRRRSAWSRYYWNHMCVYFPRWFKGVKRKEWLEQSIPEEVLQAPDCRQKIQKMIDQYFSQDSIISFDDEKHQPSGMEENNHTLAGVLQSIVSKGLAQAVAEEKAEHLNRQRPTIRTLGPAVLQKLILQIFQDLDNGHYELSQTAKHFKLSKSTLSRFAGTQWMHKELNETGDIPDLWYNTGHVLAHQPDFAAAAKEAGIWKTVTRMFQVKD